MGAAFIHSQMPLRIRSLKSQLLAGAAVTLAMAAPSVAWAADCTVNSNAGGPGGAGLGFLATPISGVVSAVGAVTSTIGTVNTTFLAQGSALVASPASTVPDQTAAGAWIRATGGRTVTDSTGSVNGVNASFGGVPLGTVGSINCAPRLREDYVGFQVGQDLARLNFGGSGANLHVGVTTGYSESKAQDISHAGGTIASFQVPFVGVYAVFTKGEFFADALLRRDFLQTSLFSPEAGLSNQRVDARSVSITGEVGYNVRLGSNWFFEPSVGVIHSVTQVDPINTPISFGNLNNPQFNPSVAVRVNDIESTLGRITARVGTSFTAGPMTVSPFGVVSVWHEFAGRTAATFNSSDFGTFAGLPLTTSGTITSSRVGTYGQFSLGASGVFGNSGWLGYARVDFRKGDNIEGLGVNAGVRYEFERPTVTAPAKGIFKAPPPKVAEPYNWAGFYLGRFVGTSWSNATWTAPALGLASNPDSAGTMAGTQIGYNYQSGNWVAGVEADLSFANNRGGKGCFTPGFGTGGQFIFNNCDNDLHTLVTATGRLGWAWDRQLLYGKAGVAWSRDHYAVECNSDVNVFFNPCAFQRETGAASRFGATLGVGFEFGFTPNWSAKVEYDRIQFGTKTIRLTAQDLFLGAGPVGNDALRVTENVNVVKLGVNYHFKDGENILTGGAAPGVSPISTGPYVGAAIGNRLSDATWRTTGVSFGAGGNGGPPGTDIPDRTTYKNPFFGSTARAGGYLGYNWQVMPRWLVGLEGDIAYSDARMSQGGIPGTYGNGANGFLGTEAQRQDSVQVKFGWDASIRGRIGYLATPNWLIYTTAGLAFEDIQISVICNGRADSYCGPGSPGVAVARGQSVSSVKTGWTLGYGIETALWQNWVGRFEYRYADLGTISNTFFARTANVVGMNLSVTSHILQAGLTYRFDIPVAAIVTKH
jgi:opacity protein-like surface antigen